jgi:hypothetical protein
MFSFYLYVYALAAAILQNSDHAAIVTLLELSVSSGWPTDPRKAAPSLVLGSLPNPRRDGCRADGK